MLVNRCRSDASLAASRGVHEAWSGFSDVTSAEAVLSPGVGEPTVIVAVTGDFSVSVTPAIAFVTVLAAPVAFAETTSF